MKIRNLTMSGAVNGQWVTPGDVIEVDDENGARYVRLGYAAEVPEEPREEHAVAPPAAETAAPKRQRGLKGSER